MLRVWKDVITFLFPLRAIEMGIVGEGRKMGRKESDGEEMDELVRSSNVEIEHGHAEEINKNETNNKIIWAAITGLIGGSATMLTNSMGPILNVYLLSIANLSPQSYIGTRAMFFCFLNLGKIPIRVVGGTLGLSMLPLALGLGAVSVVGVFFARGVLLGMEERLFVRLELGVVAFAGGQLIYVGLS